MTDKARLSNEAERLEARAPEAEIRRAASIDGQFVLRAIPFYDVGFAVQVLDVVPMKNNTAWFRFYEELNDFLPAEQRKQTLAYSFWNHPGVKDAIEALHVPHVEVELIIANGESVGFDYQLRDNDRVAVYPVFESFDITPLIKLREKPLRRTAFVLDVNLGKLARYLRLLGFDTAYRNDYEDAELARDGSAQQRIILTRDRRLLYRRAITHGYWVRAVDPEEQVLEVLQRFDLARQVCPFHRCLECNGLIERVPKQAVIDRLQPLTKQHYDTFYQCKDCGKVYWKGSHYEHMQDVLSKLTGIIV